MEDNNQNQKKSNQEIEQIVADFLDNDLKKAKDEIDQAKIRYCEKYSISGSMDSNKEMESTKGDIGKDFLLSVNQNETDIASRMKELENYVDRLIDIQNIICLERKSNKIDERIVTLNNMILNS